MNERDNPNKIEGLTNISISRLNYLKLKRLGGAGDSFNDVITALLKKLEKFRDQASDSFFDG